MRIHYIISLYQRFMNLQAQIKYFEKQPYINWQELQLMKKERLLIKDRVLHMTSTSGPQDFTRFEYPYSSRTIH